MPNKDTGSLLQRFARARSGAVGLWLAVAILPITMLVGAATDLRRVETMRGALQDASDAAVLAAAKAYLSSAASDPERLAKAQAAAGASLQGNLTETGPNLNDFRWTVTNPLETGELVLTTEARAPLAFGGLFGMSDMPVKASAASMVDIRLEVALVLDTTGSMSTNNRIGRLKTATENLIGQLDAAARQSSRTNALKIALVPYSNTVRVSAPETAPWLDGASSGPGYNETDPPPPALRDRFTRYPAGWGGCLETRPGDHDLENTPPARSDPDTLYVPYFNPGADPNAGCAVSPIMPLARDAAPVTAAVRAMQIGGLTNIPIGLAWGWNVLTPSGGPFGSGAAEPYDTPDLVKAVVLMTDGENNLGGWGGLPDDEYTGVGRMEQRRVGVGPSDDGAARQAALDRRLSTLCEAMKARGIVIYTVRVEEGSQDLLRNCASVRPDGSRRFWNVTDAQQLPGVFDNIGRELIEVRLSR